MTKIRAFQLHSDISGLVKLYGDNYYLPYTGVNAASGLAISKANGIVTLGLNYYNSGQVYTLNSLSGNVNLVAGLGIGIQKSGNSIIVAKSGDTDVLSLNTLTGNLSIFGTGMVDVWPYNASSIVISGKKILGSGIVGTQMINDILYVSASAITGINGIGSEAIYLQASGDTFLQTSGNRIYIGSSLRSGVPSINNLTGITGTLTIGSSDNTQLTVQTLTGTQTILLSYVGKGWGQAETNIYNGSGNSNTYYIGKNNIFDNANNVFANSNSTEYENLDFISAINTQNSYIGSGRDLSVINSSGCIIEGVTGSTIVNAKNSSLFNPYSFVAGFNMPNSYDANIGLTIKTSGLQVRAMCIPKTNYSGILIPTGSMVVGHIDYMAVKYNITDFYASFPTDGNLIYGRKHFIIQRGTNLSTHIRDQADLFGGNDNYGIFLTTGNNGAFYLLASGASGDQVMFNASVQYTQFVFDLNV